MSFKIRFRGSLVGKNLRSKREIDATVRNQRDLVALGPSDRLKLQETELFGVDLCFALFSQLDNLVPAIR